MPEFGEPDLDVLLPRLVAALPELDSAGQFPKYVWKSAAQAVAHNQPQRAVASLGDLVDMTAVEAIKSLYEYYYWQYQERATALRIKGARWDAEDAVVVADSAEIRDSILKSAATDAQHIFAQPFPWYSQFDQIAKASRSAHAAGVTGVAQLDGYDQSEVLSESIATVRNRSDSRSIHAIRRERGERLELRNTLARYKAHVGAADEWVVDCIHELFPTVINYRQVNLLVNAFLDRSLPRHELYWRFIQSDPGDKGVFLKAAGFVLTENDSTFNNTTWA